MECNPPPPLKVFGSAGSALYRRRDLSWKPVTFIHLSIAYLAGRSGSLLSMEKPEFDGEWNYRKLARPI